MNQQPKPFDLEAAKNGAEILCDGGPATFIAHLPDNAPAYRVVVSYSGRVYSFTEDGCHLSRSKPRLTMAPRTVKTVGYRDYYARINGEIYRYHVWKDEGLISPETLEMQANFICWIHDTWQYDEVELCPNFKKKYGNCFLKDTLAD